MDKKQPIFLYTDGAASGNPGPGGYGIVLIYGDLRKEYSEGFALTTNNRMELLAVIKGLEMIKREGANVIVTSDSKYVVDSINKNWKRKKNIDLWNRFDALKDRFNLTVNWVKGHNGHKENSRCDALAVEAYSMPNLKKDEEYIKNNTDNTIW